MIRNYLLLVLLLVLSRLPLQAQEEKTGKPGCKKGELLYKDDFDKDLSNWVSEIPVSRASNVFVKENKLIIDVDGGATVWFTKKLSQNIMIAYNRKVIMDSGKNDRLSDFNQFWMAYDPRNKNLFTRSGVFSDYDSLVLYYVGLGGNYNKTTRFRKYLGNGEKPLIKEYTDPSHLLEANKNYSVKIIACDGWVEFYINDAMYFSYKDPDPVMEGYFGFRTTESRQEISDFKIYQLQ